MLGSIMSAFYDNIGNIAVAIVLAFVYLIMVVPLELSRQQMVKSIIFPAVAAIAISVILNSIFVVPNGYNFYTREYSETIMLGLLGYFIFLLISMLISFKYGGNNLATKYKISLKEARRINWFNKKKKLREYQNSRRNNF